MLLSLLQPSFLQRHIFELSLLYIYTYFVMNKNLFILFSKGRGKANVSTCQRMQWIYLAEEEKGFEALSLSKTQIE